MSNSIILNNSIKYSIRPCRGAAAVSSAAFAAAFVVCALAAHASPAHAQAAGSSAHAAGHAAHHHPATPSASSSVPGAAAMIDGEVRKVDKAQGKVTLRHGPIQSLGMPAMTMVFKVADPGLLQGLDVGDKVRFNAERIDGNITVTAIDRVSPGG